ncbi:mitochondrial import receptor subunit TOM70 [Paragonimus westermani]|uniref:Mitochondrial import receptor subunit TOM70 n=1 Tax=Paragonimus westermani TaxID=34504 RepID=A0A5J4NUI3_9TREM|nr:mitochondrial import receptor subunit TOM70 [Paragonimus westermani]
MTISRVILENAAEGPPNKSNLKLSWKTAALFGLPVLIAGCAGISYYIYKCRNFPSSEPESIPKTPLEAAVALKNKGNKYFKAGQYAKAIQLYSEGLEHCPIDATSERAALYQNRAAAKENQRQYDSAIRDCTAALELSPRYLKALNRRAHLYEKLEAWEDCLPDVVACCIFEEFKNASNIICMDQTLKKVGQKQAQKEWEKIPHTLPSAAFIRNYLSAFAWNPFEKTPSERKPNPVSVNGTSDTGNQDNESVETNEISQEEFDSSHSQPQPPAIAEPFRSAHETLDQALDLLARGKYEASMALAFKAVSMFDSSLSNVTTVDSTKPAADGDEATLNSTQVIPHSSTTNGHETNESDSLDKILPTRVQTTKEQLSRAKAAHNKAILLHATYLALTGQAVEAKQLFQTVFADGSGAETVVRVNALIKSACLSMSVDQDFAACLYEFQTAQNACPECPDVYLHRGQINLLADQLDEALHDLNTAVKLKPEFSIAQAQRLYTLYRKALNDSNSKRALNRVEEFRRLAQKYPNCLETHSLFAQVLTERGDFSASDEEFAKVIELAPNSGLAYAHRGLLQLRWKQDRGAAFKWLTLGAKADPKCELVQELLGQLAVEQGDFDTALEHFNLAIHEAKTQNDLAHLIALREGVQAQYNACKKYDISITDVVTSLRREQQQMMMGLC